MEEVNLYDLLKYYVKNWLVLLSAIFIGAIIGLVYTNFIQTPLYKSEATILVVGARTTQDSTINNNYTELFKSRRVLDPVITDKGYSGGYNQLLSNTTATNNKDTDVILVSMSTTSAQKSQDLLAGSLDSFKNEANSLYGSNNIKIVDSASFPTSSYNVSAPLQLGLSIVACLLLAVITLFFIYDYYLSQVKRAGKAKTVRKPAAKNKNGKVTTKKSVASRAARIESLRNIFFKKPALALKTTSRTQSKKTK
ncbi:MAG: protein tyrosine kinase modulator [Patescibacteria group bacterium]|nr:protein tyrosine kinase modulator [Patescibacteria group bacterium]